MEATNKRRENLTWPDEEKTRKQLEAIRELAKELRTDYPTDTPQIWGSIRNQRLNRRNTLIRAQFSTDETAWHLINGSEWLELFDLLGFSVDKETRKRFASHLKWYSFWYADFKPRLSSKYAQRIHWYVHNFLFCLRNKLRTGKDYREGKYGSKGQAYFMEIEEQPATPSETPQISMETAETVNVSAEGENAENEPQKHISEVLKEAERNYQCVKSETLRTVREADGKWHTYFMDEEIGIDLAYDQINHIPAARAAQAAEEVAEIRRYMNRLNGNHIADADYYLAEMREGIKQAEAARRKKNADTEGENAAERAKNKPTSADVVQMVKTELAKNKAMRTAWHLEFPDGTECDVRHKCTAAGCDFYEYTEVREGEETFKDYKATERDITLYICQLLDLDAPQSPETPQTVECTAEPCKLAQTA